MSRLNPRRDEDPVGGSRCNRTLTVRDRFREDGTAHHTGHPVDTVGGIPSRLFLSCAILAIVLLGLSISWWLSFFVIVGTGVVIALSKSNEKDRTG